MVIVSESFEAVYERYAAAQKWMEGLGVTLGSGRTAFYERILGYWKDAYQVASTDEVRAAFPDFVNSIFEVFDFNSIYEAFRDVPAAQLAAIAEKLKKGVNGPINSADETPASTTARNFLFEALVAAKAHCPQRGVEAILDARSDTGIRLGRKKIWVECKRVTNIEGLERNVSKASKQLEQMFESAVGSGHRGIVALDVSKILNDGNQLLVSRNDLQLLASVDGLMDKFIAEHSDAWQRVYARRHRKVIGTIIRFSFMAKSEGRNLLVHAGQWGMNPRLGIAESDLQIQRHLVEQLRVVQ